jgi:lipopolysaccharide/colanic/teichoic acid biosynthesis glycosyltransferase
MKRLLDLLISSLGIIFSMPLILPVMFLIWIQDGHNPFYISKRVGIYGSLFKMYKLRSMIINADLTGVDSTSSTDNRITSLGHFIRKFKLDEIPQLWNVFIGEMSLVGPRPNVKREVDLYTKEERFSPLPFLKIPMPPSFPKTPSVLSMVL